MTIKDFLDARKIGYKVYPHEVTYDSQHMAEALHVPGAHVAKTVLLRVNGGFRDYVAVIPATKRVDLEKVSKALNGAQVRLAGEDEISAHCPDCESGILPPFGSQFAMETLVDESLSRHDDIFFKGTGTTRPFA